MGQPEPPRQLFGWRHVQVLVMFLVVSFAITIRVCLSVAVVVMNGKDSHSDGFQRFDWAPPEKSAVLGSFLWGYMMTQVVGGTLSARGNAIVIMTSSLIISGVLTALLPMVAIAGGWGAVVALRIVTGCFQGFIYPSCFSLIGRWVPPNERSRAGAIIFAAQPMGNILALSLSGWLAKEFGWPAVFYVFGGSTAAMALLLFALTADSPRSHPRISAAEREYILQSLDAPKKELPVPWRAMLTSLVLWSLLAAHIGYLWGYWVIITGMPTYFDNLLEVEIQWNGLLSAAPYVSMLVFSSLFGWLGDFLATKSWLTLNHNRKLMNSIGSAGPGVLCVLIAALGTRYPVVAVGMLILCGGLISATFSGALIAFVDITPNFSGIGFGLGNTIGSFISAFAPYAEGVFVDPKDPLPGWSNVFYLTAAVYIVFNLIFCIWGTAEVQPWNNPGVAAKPGTGTDNSAYETGPAVSVDRY